MALFFTADTHFGDHRTINIHRRPFATVADMDEALIDGWNAASVQAIRYGTWATLPVALTTSLGCSPA